MLYIACVPSIYSQMPRGLCCMSISWYIFCVINVLMNSKLCTFLVYLQHTLKCHMEYMIYQFHNTSCVLSMLRCTLCTAQWLCDDYILSYGLVIEIVRLRPIRKCAVPWSLLLPAWRADSATPKPIGRLPRRQYGQQVSTGQSWSYTTATTVTTPPSCVIKYSNHS